MILIFCLLINNTTKRIYLLNKFNKQSQHYYLRRIKIAKIEDSKD